MTGNTDKESKKSIEELGILYSDENNAVIKQKIDFDKVLEEVGQFGRYQVKIFGLCGVLILILTFSTSEYIFTTERIRTRCFIPECEIQNDTSKQFSAAWLKHAIPTSVTGFDQCRRFAPVTSNVSDNGTCSSLLFDSNSTVPCEAYVYENTNTVVYDFGLACDEWHRSLLGAARKLGTLFAVPLAGYLSDSYGRRVALFFTLFNTFWIGLLRYWATSYISFFLSVLFESALGAGAIYTCIFVLTVEMTERNLRIAVVAMFATIFPLSHIILGLLAYLIPYWKTLTLILYIAHLFGVLLVCMLPESARWHISRGNFDKASKTLKNIAQVNNRGLSDGTLRILKEMTMEKGEQGFFKKKPAKEPWLIMQVLQCKPILVRCVVLSVWWITFTFIYYGVAINSVNLPFGNKRLIFIAVFLFEIPGVWLTFVLINRIGRKPLMCGGFILCASTMIAFVVIPRAYSVVSIGAYVSGRIGIAGVSMTLYLYTSELFPTKYRHSLVAFCSMMGRLGSIVAPLTPAFGDKLPFILFASMGLISSVLVPTLPETLGHKLPDTMEEAASIRKSTNTEE